MNEELTRLLAYAFQVSGRRRLLEEDLVRLLSHDRRWLAPSKVRGLVRAAAGQGLLRTAGAHAFDLGAEAKEMPLPVDYRPDLATIERVIAEDPGGRAELPLFRRLVRAVSAATQTSESEVVAEVNRLQQDCGELLTAEAAAFVLARLRGVDVEALGQELEDALQRVPNAAGAR